MAILSAVAIPAFVGVQANARAAAVKNALVNGVKECVVRAADNKTTTWATAQSFADIDAFQGYTLEQGADATCYSSLARANTPEQDSNFSITMDPTDGSILKVCSNVNLPGCNGSEQEVSTTDEDTGEVTVSTSTIGSW